MTKQEFLSQLAGKLTVLNAAEREGILSYYAQMLDERIEDGMTEEAAVATMENVDDIAAEILEDHVPQTEPAENVQTVQTVPIAAEAPKKERKKGWIIALCIIVGVVATVIFPLVTAFTGLVTKTVLETTNTTVTEIEEHIAVAPSYEMDENGEMAMFYPDEVDFLKVYWEVGDVYVTVSDTDQITLREEGSLDLVKYPMVLRTGRGGLTVDYAEDHVFRGITNLVHTTASKDLYIQIPEAWVHDVMLVVGIGSVTVEDCTLDGLHIEADLGDVDLNGVDAQSVIIEADLGSVDADVRFDKLEAYLAMGDLELTAQAGSGRIEHADCDMGTMTIQGEFTYIDADCDMGDVQIVVQGAPTVIEADCDMGDVDLILPENLGFTMELDQDLGSVRIDFPVEQRFHDDDRVYTYGDGACRIELACDAGDITVKQN